MRSCKQLASPIGAAAFAILLLTPSTFAEERPENETRARARDGIRVERTAARVERGSERSGEVRQDRRQERRSTTNMRRSRGQERSAEAQRERQQRDAAARRDRDRDGRRSTGIVMRGESERRREEYRDDRDRRGDRYDRDRRNDRSDRDRRYDRNGRDRYDRGRDRGRHYDRDHRRDQRRYYAHHGRISRILRHGSGYRVWIHGAPYPFYVPHSHYRRDRFRVGVSVRIGGWYNPGGYYDYYDERSAGWIRGPIESIDYRRDTLVLRNEATGSFVTVDLGNRRHNVRPGDYVEIRGEWRRGGLFRAFDLDVLDYGW